MRSNTNGYDGTVHFISGSLRMNLEAVESLGAPAIKVGGLQIWVHGRQFPDLYDLWDGNWLRVTVHCGAGGSSVYASGSILRNAELSEWCDELDRLNKTLLGTAHLKTIEPYIDVVLKAQSLGHISMEVSITPEYLSQKHWFEFSIDQSYLSPLLKQINLLLEQYPIRDEKICPAPKL